MHWTIPSLENTPDNRRRSMLSGTREIEISKAVSRRIIVYLMDREREDGVIFREDRRCSVAVMNIRIHDHRFYESPVGLQVPDGDGDIVNHAEAFAVAGICVMKSAADVAAKHPSMAC